MGNQPDEKRTFQGWIQALPGEPPSTLPSLDQVTSLRGALMGPGLDAWPVQILRALPDVALEALILVFDLAEAYGLWPTKLCMVRTQLTPKGECDGTILSPSSLRPIAVISTWLDFGLSGS